MLINSFWRFNSSTKCMLSDLTCLKVTLKGHTYVVNFILFNGYISFIHSCIYFTFIYLFLQTLKKETMVVALKKKKLYMLVSFPKMKILPSFTHVQNLHDFLLRTIKEDFFFLSIYCKTSLKYLILCRSKSLRFGMTWG